MFLRILTQKFDQSTGTNSMKEEYKRMLFFLMHVLYLQAKYLHEKKTCAYKQGGYGMSDLNRNTVNFRKLTAIDFITCRIIFSKISNACLFSYKFQSKFNLSILKLINQVWNRFNSFILLKWSLLILSMLWLTVQKLDFEPKNLTVKKQTFSDKAHLSKEIQIYKLDVIFSIFIYFILFLFNLKNNAT